MNGYAFGFWIDYARAKAERIAKELTYPEYQLWRCEFGPFGINIQVSTYDDYGLLGIFDDRNTLGFSIPYWVIFE